MSDQPNDLLQAAIVALQQGDRRSAMRKLAHLLEREPRNAEAWYWLSKTQEDVLRKRQCLVRALRFQPTHALARRELESLEAIRPTQPELSQPSSTLLKPATAPLRPQPSAQKLPLQRRRGTSPLWLWFSFLGLLLVGTLCLGVLFLSSSLWQPTWQEWSAQLNLPTIFSAKSDPLPDGLSVGYWILEIQRPLPQGVYIGDLVLLPEGIFWFGYLRGQYLLEDEQTLSLCVQPREKGASATCFWVRVSAAEADQVTLDVQIKSPQGERWVEGLVYRKILGDRRRPDLASDLVGRWQPFPLDHHTRIAQVRSGEGSVDDVYLFTASGELWAGGRRLSSYRVEENTIRVPEYYGEIGERFQVDRLGDWMALVGQINKPPLILSLKRVP